MDRSFSGRVALITGASGGIGQALARRLATDGAVLALGYGTSGQAAETLAAEITSAGGTAIAVGADLRRAEAPGQLVQAATQALGPVDVLVSNAGLSRVQPLEDITAAQFDEMLAVNLRAPFLLAQAAVPAMRERGFGRILFISSVAAFTGGIVGPHYAASKAGLHGLTHFLASRLAASGITVNALAPALVAQTGMLPGDPAQLRRQVPVGRLGQPSEVADLAAAILVNAYLTNQVISLDGGIHPR
jgi:3-oxoacyl-[acyl-carrier protein] reductase